MKYAPFAALVLVLGAGPVLAQEAPRPAHPPRAVEAPKGAEAVPNYDANAPETQQRLQQLLQQYPPQLSSVLTLDPTLLSNQAYLQLYPQLAAFLAQHPEIAHNPGYFLPQYHDSRRGYDYNDPRVMAIRSVNEAMAGLGFLIGFLAVVGTIGWLIRTAIEHRKWLRVSKTHTDTHTKLLDRLTSNDDLTAYMQSPAGQRFLNAAPLPIDGGQKAVAAPFGRILWSVQAGVVIAFLGAALIYASSRFAGNDLFSEVELPLFVMGSATVAIGTGFFISSFVAYGLSRRLGLLPSTQPSAPDSATGPNQ